MQKLTTKILIAILLTAFAIGLGSAYYIQKKQLTTPTDEVVLNQINKTPIASTSTEGITVETTTPIQTASTSPIEPSPDEEAVKAQLSALATTTTITWDQARNLINICGVSSFILSNGRYMRLVDNHKISIDWQVPYTTGNRTSAVKAEVSRANKKCSEKITIGLVYYEN